MADGRTIAWRGPMRTFLFVAVLTAASCAAYAQGVERWPVKTSVPDGTNFSKGSMGGPWPNRAHRTARPCAPTRDPPSRESAAPDDPRQSAAPTSHNCTSPPASRLIHAYLCHKLNRGGETVPQTEQKKIEFFRSL